MGQKREMAILLESQTCSEEPKLGDIRSEITVLSLSLPEGMFVTFPFTLYTLLSVCIYVPNKVRCSIREEHEIKGKWVGD